jgi:hypothetical protein
MKVGQTAILILNLYNSRKLDSACWQAPFRSGAGQTDSNHEDGFRLVGWDRWVWWVRYA